MSPRTRRVIKGHRAWWTERGLLALAVLTAIVGVVITVGIALWLEWVEAAIAFGFFWCVLMAGVFIAFRMSAPDPVSVVDTGEMNRVREEIRSGRIKMRKDLAAMERSLIEQGQRSPVLDAWRLDPSYASLHPLVSYIDTSVVEPSAREFLLRIQLDAFEIGMRPAAVIEMDLLRDIASLLWMAARDPYYLNIRSFIDTVIVEAYASREDEHHVDIPYPVLSIQIACRSLAAMRSDPAALRSISDIRVNGGKEIEPHRSIPATHMARGAK